jgi:uncharacterized membrane protein YhhN
LCIIALCQYAALAAILLSAYANFCLRGGAMPIRRALVEDRPFLIISLVLAIAFPLLRDGVLGDVYLMIVKGGAVASLAAYAVRRLSGANAILLALFMGLSALGDALIIIDMGLGGGAFFAAHLFAIFLFSRHRRSKLAASQTILAFLLLAATPLLSYLLTLQATNWLLILYSAVLGLMACLAWSSAYPRYQVGIGAILFVISDLLLFGSMGLLEQISLAGALVWPIYYIGQLMICTGVVRALRNN